MTIEAKITMDVGEFLRNVVASIDKKAIQRMMLAAEHAAGEVRRHAPHDRGGLIRSYKATMLTSRDLGELRSGAVSDLAYAKIQDEGEDIRPKPPLKYLAIPIGDRARKTAGLWPRDWSSGDLFFYKTKSGKPSLAKRKQAPGRDFVQYVLKRSVHITGSGYLDAAAKAAEPAILEILGDQIQVAIGEVDN